MLVFQTWEDEEDLCGRVQEIQDKLIEDTGAVFIHQLPISCPTFVGSPFRRSIIIQRGLPRRRLESLFSKAWKESYIAGKGVNCSGFGRFAFCSINVTVDDDEGESILNASWETFIDRCKLPESAVISIWGVSSNGKLLFIIRHDGNMEESSTELPALPPFAKERQQIYDERLMATMKEVKVKDAVKVIEGGDQIKNVSKSTPGCLPFSFWRKK